MRELLRGFADRGGTVLLSSHLLAEVEAVADRMIIIGGGRIQAQGSRAELLTASGTIVETDDLATLDAVLDNAGLTSHPADGDRRLVEAEPEAVARLAMANDVVLRRLAPADEAGLERLYRGRKFSGFLACAPCWCRHDAGRFRGEARARRRRAHCCFGRHAVVRGGAELAPGFRGRSEHVRRAVHPAGKSRDRRLGP